MADDDDRVRVAREEALEPERAFEVEVVRRLVEEKKVRLVEEERGKRHAHAPAAREVGAGPRLRGGIETEPGENACGARLRRVGADVGEAGVDLGDAVRVAGVLGLGKQLVALAVGGEHRLKQRVRAAGRLLLDAADPGAFRNGDRAGIGGEVAGDRAEERGLPGAVAPDKAGLRSRRERQARALKERASGNAERQVGDLQHRASV